MTIADNVNRVREIIAAACARAGRDPASVTLVAVSKTHPALAVDEAAAAGVQHFGENRVEEAVTKIPAVKAMTDRPITWHMIGHVQSRKAKDVLPLFQVVHSVDTVKLAEKLSREVVARGGALDVLLEVNISGEASKAGFAAHGWQSDAGVRETLTQEIVQVMSLPGLRVRGFMTMAPIVPEMEQARPVFAGLAALRASLAESLHVPLPDLSMGMTDDYPVAIEEGATLVRIGRALFGERQSRQ
jgi:pyridoxal phosphate enzyme (YggS family)